jgi:hypothetical protein
VLPHSVSVYAAQPSNKKLQGIHGGLSTCGQVCEARWAVCTVRAQSADVGCVERVCLGVHLHRLCFV